MFAWQALTGREIVAAFEVLFKKNKSVNPSSPQAAMAVPQDDGVTGEIKHQFPAARANEG